MFVKKCAHACITRTCQEFSVEQKFTLFVSVVGNLGCCLFTAFASRAQKEGDAKKANNYGTFAGLFIGIAFIVQMLFDFDALKIR
ncbi:MAG: hypothetical protein J6P00_04765 [Acetobacter sp.]|nr:hypothetical protein [Acetobacter sp.]MBO6091511.1 hypothetical protein [Acetobacter sp.]MBO7072910.1 hypothetical protein [Acetobacter sp.]MBO7350406.1 hypothetical protein [Acetobacter sp.]MBQ3817901.1 hypothetical protein [Acetobacter sp.]